MRLPPATICNVTHSDPSTQSNETVSLRKSGKTAPISNVQYGSASLHDRLNWWIAPYCAVGFSALFAASAVVAVQSGEGMMWFTAVIGLVLAVVMALWRVTHPAARPKEWMPTKSSGPISAVIRIVRGG